jgi:nucleoside-diphosphate-sugar epimerase
MSKVFIVGGAGKIGRQLGAQLVAAKHDVRSLYRHEEQLRELKSSGVHPVWGSLIDLDVGTLASEMQGCEVAVFAAGAGGKKAAPK